MGDDAGERVRVQGAERRGVVEYVIPPELCIPTLVLAVAILDHLFEYINPRLREQ